MSSRFTTRPLRPDDVDALLAFYRQLPAWIVHWYDPFPDPDLGKIGGHLAQASAGAAISLGLVAPDGAIAGHGFIQGLDTPAPTFGIGLTESLVGMGWGWRLMTAVLAAGDARRLPKIILTVFKVNMAARHLYEALGFVSTGECQCRPPGDSLGMERLCGGGSSRPGRLAAPRKAEDGREKTKDSP